MSPDHGVSNARKLAELLHSPIAIIDNRDDNESTTSPDAVIGSVKGKRAILIDDIIDTGVRLQTQPKRWNVQVLQKYLPLQLTLFLVETQLKN